MFLAGQNTHGQCMGGEVSLSVRLATRGTYDSAGSGPQPGSAAVRRLALGHNHTLALLASGDVYAAGANDAAQLGRGAPTADDCAQNCAPRLVRVPAALGCHVRFVSVSAGYKHSAALSEAGGLYAWGSNAFGQCGRRARAEEGGVGQGAGQVEAANTTDVVLWPTRCARGALARGDVDREGCVVAVSCGMSHTLAVKRDGRGLAFGSNNFGQLGRPTAVAATGAAAEGGARAAAAAAPVQHFSLPALVAGDAVSAARLVGCTAGVNSTFLLDDQGVVYACGNNIYGELGLGDGGCGVTQRDTPATQRDKPAALDAAHFGGESVVAVAAGRCHSVMLTAGGRVFASGQGAFGATGLGHVEDTAVPMPVVGALAAPGAVAVRMATGLHHSTVLTSDGRVFVFGCNESGALGIGIRYLDQHCFMEPQLAKTQSALGALLPELEGGGGAGRKPGVPGEREEAGPVGVPAALPACFALGGGCFACHSAFLSGHSEELTDLPGNDVPVVPMMDSCKPAAAPPRKRKLSGTSD
jgi:alpha-tubulin suppressor-like RCC1 family protein